MLTEACRVWDVALFFPPVSKDFAVWPWSEFTATSTALDVLHLWIIFLIVLLIVTAHFRLMGSSTITAQDWDISLRIVDLTLLHVPCSKCPTATHDRTQQEGTNGLDLFKDTRWMYIILYSFHGFLWLTVHLWQPLLSFNGFIKLKRQSFRLLYPSPQVYVIVFDIK